LELEVAPVDCPEANQRVAFWREHQAAGHDLTSVHVIAVNTAHQFRFRSDHLLAAPATAASVDLYQPPATLAWQVETATRRRGTMHGIGGWFSARMSESVRMSNSPVAPNRIQRRNTFFPIDPPIDVAEGDHIRISMGVRLPDLQVSWRVEVRNAGSDASAEPRARAIHSTLMTGPTSE
jgi:hypothetical protein